MAVITGEFDLEVRMVEEEAEELTCPKCNSVVQPDDQECYLCGSELSEEGLNYDLEDDDESSDIE